jgi:cobalt-zinc-cadmium resistance protein CzcA
LSVCWPARTRKDAEAIRVLPLSVLVAGAKGRLGDVLEPAGKEAQFVRLGASTIYREDGRRMLPLRFTVRGRDAAGVLAEARRKAAPLVPATVRIEWPGP